MYEVKNQNSIIEVKDVTEKTMCKLNLNYE